MAPRWPESLTPATCPPRLWHGGQGQRLSSYSWVVIRGGAAQRKVLPAQLGRLVSAPARPWVSSLEQVPPHLVYRPCVPQGLPGGFWVLLALPQP